MPYNSPKILTELFSFFIKALETVLSKLLGFLTIGETDYNFREVRLAHKVTIVDCGRLYLSKALNNWLNIP